MKVRVLFDGADRYDGRVYRVKAGRVYDLPGRLADTYLARGRAERVASVRPAAAKVVAPADNTADMPDQTPTVRPDETPEDVAPSDKDAPDPEQGPDDGEVVALGGGWYLHPDGSKRRGRP